METLYHWCLLGNLCSECSNYYPPHDGAAPTQRLRQWKVTLLQWPQAARRWRWFEHCLHKSLNIDTSAVTSSCHQMVLLPHQYMKAPNEWSSMQICQTILVICTYRGRHTTRFLRHLLLLFLLMSYKNITRIIFYKTQGQQRHFKQKYSQ